jgi:hypothetical protein
MDDAACALVVNGKAGLPMDVISEAGGMTAAAPVSIAFFALMVVSFLWPAFALLASVVGASRTTMNDNVIGGRAGGRSGHTSYSPM